MVPIKSSASPNDTTPAPLSPEREAKIRTREQAATPGPWTSDGAEIYGTLGGILMLDLWVGETLNIDNQEQSNANATFIAAARMDVPELMTEVQRLRERYDHLDKVSDEVMAERDAHHDALDRFALAVAPEEVIGEHSSGNNPWANAFELVTPAAEVDALRARVTKLETALAATGRSLSSFIFDSEDPGADALGAQWLYGQAMPEVDDPFAQPRAFRSSVFSEASKEVEEMYSLTPEGQSDHPQAYLDGYLDGLQDAAERLEKLADQAAEGSEPVSPAETLSAIRTAAQGDDLPQVRRLVADYFAAQRGAEDTVAVTS